MSAVTVVAVAILSLNYSMYSQERLPINVSALGPQVGEQVPDFRLPDQYGIVRTLESIMGEKGAMLLFHRSANW